MQNLSTEGSKREIELRGLRQGQMSDNIEHSNRIVNRRGTMHEGNFAIWATINEAWKENI